MTEEDTRPICDITMHATEKHKFKRPLIEFIPRQPHWLPRGEGVGQNIRLIKH